MEEDEWAMSSIVMENTWCSSETEYGGEISSLEQHQCKFAGITESQEKPRDVPTGENFAERSKGASDSQGP